MSPGPAVVPVERYIGSCLISSSAGYSKKDRYRYPCLPEFYPPAAAGWGVPLVGPPVVHRRPSVKIKDSVKEERSPLSRLAIHTQGAPLIQAQRQNQPRKGNKPAQPKPSAPPQQPSTVSQEESPNENSLPRIIKPRKRRKKDRKPQPPPPVVSESSIVTLKPYTPLCQEYGITQTNVPPVIEEAPPLIRKIEEEPIPEPPTVTSDVANCCCRYCDPASTVWESPLSSPSSFSSAEWSTLQVSSEIITSPNGHRDIEIKFFSSPPPQQQQQHQHTSASHRPISVAPPWQ